MPAGAALQLGAGAALRSSSLLSSTLVVGLMLLSGATLIFWDCTARHTALLHELGTTIYQDVNWACFLGNIKMIARGCDVLKIAEAKSLE